MQDTPEDGRRTHRPKRCEYNDKDKDDTPKTMSNKISKRHTHYY